jgi:copper chaperone NosL
MNRFFGKSNEFLELPLGSISRLLLLLAAIFAASVYVAPLWNLTMFAPQYPDGLRLDIYSYKLSGGNKGQDVKEINVLNHYIGMKDIVQEDFTEFKWMPFVVGALALLFLRAAVLGRMTHLVDAFVLYIYFGLFSLWSLAFKLYAYGHNLAPTAAVRVAPFMPPVFGHRKIANFDIYSYPKSASYLLALAAVALLISIVFAWREQRSQGGDHTLSESPA